MRPPHAGLSVLLVLLLALVAWGPSVVADGYALDDAELIEGNPVVEGTVSVRAAFSRDYWHHREGSGHYRPLAALSLRVDRALWGSRVAGYHATNVALHLLVVLAAAVFLLRAVPRPGPLLWGLALFAVHPALADSVAWISGRTSGLAALGGLLGLLGLQAALRRPSGAARGTLVVVAAGLGILLGILAKEEAVVFAVAYVLLALGTARREALLAGLGAAAGVAVYLALRRAALGTWFFGGIDAPLAEASLLERLPYAGRALLEALRVAVVPLAHPPSYRAVPGFSPADPPGLVALLGWLPWLALLTAGAYYLRRSPSRLAAAGALLAALAFLPVLQFVPTAKVFAPRFLHLPLLLGVPFLAAALARISPPVRLLLLVGLLPFAWMRGAIYSDRVSYERAVLEEVPLDAAAWNNLGLALEEQGDFEGAAAAWERGIAIDPRYSKLWNNLGAHQMRARDYPRAAETLRKAVRHGPGNPLAHCNLGNALLRLRDFSEAGLAYERATELAPGNVAAWRGLARARHGEGRTADAAAAIDRALQLDPADERALDLRRELEALD